MPTVSVLIPAFRATATIREAVDSILACEASATGKVEVVVAPDDGSGEYATAFAGAPGVLVLEPTWRLGPGPSRNRARAASSGKWLTMLDADDAVSPGYLDELLSLAQSTRSDCVFSRIRYEHDGQPVRELPEASVLDAAAMAAFAGSIHALYRRELWIDYPDTLAEDAFVDASLLDAVGGTAPLSGAIYRARLRPDGICATTPQATFNTVYRQVLGQSPSTVVTDVFAAKLTLGLLHDRHIAGGGALSFHHFVARTMNNYK